MCRRDMRLLQVWSFMFRSQPEEGNSEALGQALEAESTDFFI